VPRSALQDEVQVLVSLLAHEGDRGNDAVDVPLEAEARLRDARRPRKADEVGDGGATDAEQAWPILERLHRPALGPTAEGACLS
jgi:hypothetical protein